MSDDPVRDSRRKSGARLFVVFALVIAAIFGARELFHRSQVRHATMLRASVHACLFGAPLEPGERASDRLHRIALADPPHDWPARCDRYLEDFEEATRDLGEVRGAYVPAAVDLDAIEAHPSEFDAYWERTAPRPDVAAPDDVPAAPPTASSR